MTLEYDNKTATNTFHMQVAEHIVFTKSFFGWQPSKEQVYDYAESLYLCSFKELVDRTELEKYGNS